MKNLAGSSDADKTILEELYLAGIPAIKVEKSDGEVPYIYVGKFGNWTFTRRWSYWSANVERTELGLPVETALILYNKKNPVRNDILGKIIRSGGDAGCSSPDGYTAQPVIDSDFNNQLEKMGYKKIFDKTLDMEYISITVGEIAKLCNTGKLNVKRYVRTYHIDEQIGLNEFVKFLRNEVDKKILYNGYYCRIIKVWEGGFYDLQTIEKTKLGIIEQYLSVPEKEIKL